MRLIKFTYTPQQRTYAAALRLVRKVDANLESRCVHYRDANGKLLTTLDEVVRAILANDLAIDEPVMELAA